MGPNHTLCWAKAYFRTVFADEGCNASSTGHRAGTLPFDLFSLYL